MEKRGVICSRTQGQGVAASSLGPFTPSKEPLLPGWPGDAGTRTPDPWMRSLCASAALSAAPHARRLWTKRPTTELLALPVQPQPASLASTLLSPSLWLLSRLPTLLTSPADGLG